MDQDDGTLGRLVSWLFLGNRRGPIIKFEDSGTPEERDMFMKSLEENHPRVEAICLGIHGGGMPMPYSLLKEKMEYEERSKTLFGRITNRFYDALDYLW